MRTSRSFVSLASAAAVIASFACASTAEASVANSTEAATTVHHTTTLPPIVPLGSMLGMSLFAGIVGIALGRRRQA